MRILLDDLKLFPYKIQILQKQTDDNNAERLAFCQDISQKIEKNRGLLNLIFFSDEAHCHLSGHINKQNMRYCSQAHPHEHTHQPLSQEKVTVWCARGRNGIVGHEHTHQPLSQEKVTVWCARGQNGIVGPYFFEDERGNCVTMDTDRYIALMRSEFIPAPRKKRGVDINSVIYQQDGAPPHCSD